MPPHNALSIDMDTDSLTRDAYRVLVGRSGEVSEYLCTEMGSCASRYPREDSYLGAMHQLVSTYAETPEDFLESWDLLDAVNSSEFAVLFTGLAEEILAVIRTPLDQRGQSKKVVRCPRQPLTTAGDRVSLG